MVISDPAKDLRTLLASRRGLIVAAGRDEARLTSMIRLVAGPLRLPIWSWTVAAGLAVSGGRGQPGTTDPAQALAFVSDSNQPGVYVFLDAKPLLDDPVAVRLARELGQRQVPGRTVILTGVGDQVPTDLQPDGVLFRPRPPDRAEIDEMLSRTLAGLQSSGMAIRLDPAQRAELVTSLAGLTLVDAERLVIEYTVSDGLLGAGDLQAIRRAKAELLAVDSPLELIATDVTMANVGGLDHLKAWLVERGRGFEPAARQFGLPMPRGVLLTGVPGTGKSLVAKAIAASWGMALVALDTGRIHGSLVGESEQRMRAALDAVEVMAPVVLWVDEIEKGFRAGGDNDGGVSSRVLGVLLNWLQERPDGIFVVATSNDVSALPPELTRRGRIDEVFFVDLPTPVERTAVVTAHLSARGWDPRAFDVAAVVASTEGYSGAELEAIVVGALYAAYAANSPLTTNFLLTEAHEMVPLSVLRAEDIDALRSWARGRAVRA
ncbi:MAG: hypothetical protein QG671_85 [Actinomycetota bacterium]|nr:hypothetical protein [Actinomycetota bacterium]HQZ85458.1 AAA family ATPase [Actinomycetota bacterium]